jgi:hypothetical protein
VNSAGDAIALGTSGNSGVKILSGGGDVSLKGRGSNWGVRVFGGLTLNSGAGTTTIIGQTPTAGYQGVTFGDVGTTSITSAAESGKTFFLNATTEFVSTLPAPAAGLNYTFIVTAAPSGASYTVVTAGSANIIKGQAVNAAGVAGDTGTADDTISFVDGQAVAGDEVRVISDGTSWFAKAFCAVAAGVTFTQASA